jgi:hypothetical protein
MKRAALVLLLLGTLIFIGLGAYLLLSQGRSEEPVPVPSQGGNPFGFLTGADSDSLKLTLDDGSAVAVPDFTETDQPDWAGESAGYQVAGDAMGSYLITYIPADQQGSQAQFLIALLAEPLGANRLAAEAELKSALGLSEAELCMLDAQVWTNGTVNQTYEGYDLGLSFCPGATALP